jgi:hypothetical protein
MLCYGTAKEACRFYNSYPATLLRWAHEGKIRYKAGLGGRNRQYEIVLDWTRSHRPEGLR